MSPPPRSGRSASDPITAAAAEALIGSHLRRPFPPDALSWQDIAEYLMDLRRRRGPRAYGIARQHVEFIHDVARISRRVKDRMRQIEADHLPKDWFERLDDPAIAAQIADHAGHYGLWQLDRDLSEVPRRYQVWLTGRRAAPWEPAAHEIWLLISMIFASMKQRIGRQPTSPFIRAVTDVVHRIGFTGATENAIAQWAKRHRDILPQPQQNRDKRW
jgi:hypothetical protein